MKLSLAKINFLNVLFTALLFCIVIGLFTVKITNDSYEERIADLEQTYIQENKLLVREEVARAISRIKTLEKVIYENLKDNLEEKVKYVYDISKNGIHSSFTHNGITESYAKELDLFKWDNSNGYFYIFTGSGKMLYHGANKSFVGKDIFKLAKNNKKLSSFLKEAILKDKSFGSYSWYKPSGEKNKLYKKYVYVKKLDNYDIYIAAGIYKSQLQKTVQNIFFKELDKDRFGKNKYGYFWVHDLSNIMRIHPIRKELNNQDLTKYKTLDGQFLFPNMNKLVLEKEKGYIKYKWYKTNSEEIDEKISFVHLLKEWGMVIGSGFYLTELKDQLVSEKKKLKESLSLNLQKIFMTLFILIILSLLGAWFISQKIRKIEISQKEHLNMLKQYKLILDKSAIVSKTDKKGIVTYINSNFTKISGYTKDEIIGKPHNIVRHPETPKSQLKKLWANIQSGKIWKGMLKNKKKDGNSYFNNSTIVPIKDSEGNILEYISAGTDVTELFENRTKLQSIFKTDSLTGLGNRVSLLNTITKNWQGVLSLINIDRFKEVNDIQGHEVGDKIIKELGLRLFEFFSDEKYKLFRVQADIFALFTLEKEPSCMISEIEEFMKNEGREPYKYNNQAFLLTYTCGIANNTENLLTYADMALNEAKNKKVKIKLYDTSMNNIEEYKQNIIWVEKLHKAIAEDKIVPYYQPIYNYKTKKIEKYECLMRLIEGDKIILPFEYLDIAKKTKLYPELTYKMVAKAISKFANEKEEFSINLSVEDLMNENLMQFIYNYAEQKDVFKRMVLEIVESEEIEDSDQISRIIKKFKNKGTKVAIDDFGTGYSNYDYLISLQADYIKIDGSITKHLLDDERTSELVKSIVNFAKKSNIKTIAEFVSDEKIDEKVRSLDIDYAQGWYYGKAEKELL